MSWPTPQEYNEAVQNSLHNFADEELRKGAVQVNSIGLPRVASGAFASVYRMHCPSRDVAVRCFLKNTADQHARYAEISSFVMTDDLECTVGFEYVEQGIKIGSEWYPILKMEWVEGHSLDLYVRHHVSDSAKMAKLLESTQKTAMELRRGGIAHGDLQHGNIIVRDDGSYRLVDYDGMFVPKMGETLSNELGHRNYQNPARDAGHFGPYLDNFSAWSIYTSIFCLSKDPSLLERLQACDECLLFRQVDYRYPLKSKAFYTLENHPDLEIRAAARRFRSLLDRKIEEIPYLDETVVVPDNLPNVGTRVPRGTGVQSDSNLPDWVQSGMGADDNPLPAVGELDLDDEAAVPWPSLKEYIVSASHPAKYIKDAELKTAILALDRGQIHPLVSRRGAVFRYHLTDGTDVAVKVFLLPDRHRQQHYELLSEYLLTPSGDVDKLRQHMVDFEYIEDGITVGTVSYPIIKMKWINGSGLFETVEKTRNSKESLRWLIAKFEELMRLLRQCRVIHGDLDPDNIMIKDGNLILLDYDRMRTPNMAGMPIKFGGNKHFRHPLCKKYQAAGNDQFAAWLLYASLRLLIIQPDLWNNAGVNPGRLLFSDLDLINPSHGASNPKLRTQYSLFYLLDHHYSKEVRDMSAELQKLLQQHPNQIRPFFETSDLTLFSASKNTVPVYPPGTLATAMEATATNDVAGFMCLYGGMVVFVLSVVSLIWSAAFGLFLFVASVALFIAAFRNMRP